MRTNESFLRTNLDNKILHLQEEHKIVLSILYDDACKKGTVHDFKFDEHRNQSMKYTNVREKAKSSMSDEVLYICLLDLEQMGFILNTMRNPYNETEYAIYFLGLEYFKRLA